MKRLFIGLFLIVFQFSFCVAQQDFLLDGEWQMTIADKEYKVQVPHT